MNKHNNLQYSEMPFKYQCIMFIGFSFVLMLFCTKSSPLFVFNDWYDANVYFTMGKGMMNGYVPYVDLIDNKGPLLYFIYGVAWLFDHTGFWGVYLFQSLFLAISIIFMYRLALLFITNKHIAFLVAVCSPIPMLIELFYAENYDFGGGGPDEFCRALMIVSLFYFTLLYVKPDYYKLSHTFLQGVLFMCVFLIKFNLTVFWIGFILSFSVELLYKKKFSFLIKHMICFITGAFITAAPYLIYGIFTKSLKAFMNTYFLYNWTYVNPNNHMLLKTIESIISAIGKMGSLWGFSLLFSVGLVFVFFVCKTGFKIGYSISLLLLFTAIYYTTVRFATIHIPFTIAILFGIIAVGILVERYIKKCRFHMSMTLVGAVLIIGITIHLNGLTTYDLFLTEQPTAQQQIAEVM